MITMSLLNYFPPISESIWIVIISVAIWFYNYVRTKQSYWQKLGIIGPRPLFLLGTQMKMAFKSWPELTIEDMEKYGKLYGGYSMLNPILFVLKPELIKLVLIKDFHCFLNREKMRLQHEILNQNLVFAEDEKWKRMRMIISPSFSSRKLRKMNSMMNKCLDRLFECLNQIIYENQGIMEAKKIIAGLTIDMIATTSFGIETNTNDLSKSLFVKHGLRLFDINPLRMIASLILPIPVLKWLNIKTLGPPEPFDWFINMTNKIIKQRKSVATSKQRDLLQFMLDSEVDEKKLNENCIDFQTNISFIDDEKSESPSEVNTKSTVMKKLTETEIIANSIFFLITGFETTASTISHTLFLLAWYPNIQERLHNELKNHLKDLDINSDEYYDRVMSTTTIPYLEAVIKETLRLYPAITIIGRRLKVDKYLLGDIPLLHGQVIQIPIHAIHHCPDYYENPYEFNPERFMPENEDHLIPYTYLPFGLGPRSCIGMRFAYQEIKLSLARLLVNYLFQTATNTPRKLIFNPRSFFLSTKPFQLKITKR